MSSSQQPRNEKKISSLWKILSELVSRRPKKTTQTYHPLKRSSTLDIDELPYGSGSFIDIWSIVAVIIFLFLAGSLIIVCLLMWIPRQLNDIKGLHDDTPVHDLFATMRQTDGAPQYYSFSESELNRYLKQTCRMRQKGALSIVAHPAQLALKIHDGYGELIITRVIGSHLYHTISVYVSFSYSGEHAQRRVSLELLPAGEDTGLFPRGGRIGQLPIPQRYMQMILPSLESLLDVYPELTRLIQTHDFLPVFQRDNNESEGRLFLTPPHNETFSTLH